MSTIKEYLRCMIEINQSTQAKEFYEWINSEGKYYTYDKTSSESILEGYVSNLIQPKGCFNNSYIALELELVDSYIEGYYVTDILMPFDHAFNLLDGKAIDLTSTKMGFTVNELYGIEIPKEVLDTYHSDDKYSFVPILNYYFYKYIQKSKYQN